MEATIHTEIMEMPAGEPHPESTLLLLMDGMQEAAGRHVDRLGWGIRDLQARGLTWVLARNHLHFCRPVMPGKTYRIHTWPSGKRRILAIRDFRVLDGSGTCIVKATSGWLLLQVTSRRPSRLDDDSFDILSLPDRAIRDDFSPLPRPEGGERSGPFPVKPQDIDINNHTNNLVYLEWALSSLPPATRSCRRLEELEMAFLGEARLGDAVTCQSQRLEGGSDGEVWVQRLQQDASDRDLARLRSRWK